MLPEEIILISLITSFFTTVLTIIICCYLCGDGKKLEEKDKKIKYLEERNAYLEKNIDRLLERVHYYEELTLWRRMTKE